MPPQVDVRQYNIAELRKCLSHSSNTLPAFIANKRHTKYFETYLEALGAQTIVIEVEYIDRDFLDDFSKFYVRCFGQIIRNTYKGYCTRLHFFNISFDSEKFLNLISNIESDLTIDQLQEAYIGFMIVKPIPSTIIGRTCVKTYDSDGGRRNFTPLRNYYVNLYGIPLELKQSMAFQEQDSVVAACATSALWSVFQITGVMFQHSIPTPVEITEMATMIPEELVPGTLPNRGLTSKQMIHAIRQLSLEPYVINAQSVFLFKSSLYAYLRMGIPAVLNVNLWDTSDSPSDLFSDFPGHSVAVSGYSLGGDIEPYGDSQFRLRASRIDEIYVHDDQIGPYAWMKFDGNDIDLEFNCRKSNYHSLFTSWRGGNGEEGSVRAVQNLIIFPLYPKIRLNIEYVLNVMIEFDRFVRESVQNVGASIGAEIEWDIFLSTVNSFKQEIRINTLLQTQEKRKIVLEPAPKYIWRIIGFINGIQAIELLFDATDIQQGFYFNRAINYNQELFDILSGAAEGIINDETIQTKSIWHIIDWLSKAH